MSTLKTNEVSMHRRYIRINGKLHAKSFLRKTDADRWYVEKKREKELIESGVQCQVLDIEFGEYANQWMLTRKGQGVPESSWKTDERRLRLHLLPKMAKRPLQKISRREWDEFLNSLTLSGELKPATRNRIQALVSKMYTDAVRQELVSTNPLSVIPKLHESQGAWDYWESPDDCRRYLEHAEAEGPAFQVFAFLALNTGARLGEILAFRHQEVQLERRSLHLWRTYEQETHKMVERTKGKSGRWLGINDALYQALHRHRVATPFKKPGDLLVYRDDTPESLKTCLPMEEWMIRRRHYRTCARAGVKPIRVHDLRHTYASHYVMNGGNKADLQGLLGHSTPMMTDKYAHLTPGHLKAKSGVVDFTGTDTANGSSK